MSTNPEPKYRPVLTASQIDTIMSLAKAVIPLTNESLSIITTLAPFQAKVRNGALKPAYSTIPVQSVEEQLGIVPPPTVSAMDKLSPEAKRLYCYEKYRSNTDECTVEEIELAQTYMYENDLMSAEEEARFELRSLQ